MPCLFSADSEAVRLITEVEQGISLLPTMVGTTNVQAELALALQPLRSENVQLRRLVAQWGFLSFGFAAYIYLFLCIKVFQTASETSEFTYDLLETSVQTPCLNHYTLRITDGTSFHYLLAAAPIFFYNYVNFT